MNYLLLIYEDEKALHDRDEKTRNEVVGEYNAFTASVREAGHYVAAAALQPTTTATPVRVRASTHDLLQAVLKTDRARILSSLIRTCGGDFDLAEELTPVPHDMLRLIFTCCHPALNEEAQLALTLRTVAGLPTIEIARAFLVSEQTMAQRLVRAKTTGRRHEAERAYQRAIELATNNPERRFLERRLREVRGAAS